MAAALMHRGSQGAIFILLLASFFSQCASVVGAQTTRNDPFHVKALSGVRSRLPRLTRTALAQLDNTPPVLLLSISIASTDGDVELLPKGPCHALPILLPAAKDAVAAAQLATLRLQVHAQDTLSGTDPLGGRPTITLSPGTSPDVLGFDLGTVPSEGMLKAWPPGRRYTMVISATDRAGNTASCPLTFQVQGPSINYPNERFELLDAREAEVPATGLHGNTPALGTSEKGRKLLQIGTGPFLLRVWNTAKIPPGTPETANGTIGRLGVFGKQSLPTFDFDLESGFSVRLSGTVRPTTSGNYTFQLIRRPVGRVTTLFFNGVPVLTAKDCCETDQWSTVLTAGTAYSMQVDMIDPSPRGRNWNVLVTWTGPGDGGFPRIVGDSTPGCASGFLRTSPQGRCMRAISFNTGTGASPVSLAEADRLCGVEGGILTPILSLQDSLDASITCMDGSGCWVGIRQADNQTSPIAGWTTSYNKTCPSVSVPYTAWQPGYPTDAERTEYMEDNERNCGLLAFFGKAWGGLVDTSCNDPLYGAVCSIPEPTCSVVVQAPPPPPAVSACPRGFSRGPLAGRCLAKINGNGSSTTFSKAQDLCAARQSILAPMTNARDAYDAIASCGYMNNGLTDPCWVSLQQLTNATRVAEGWQTVTASDCSGTLGNVNATEIFPEGQPNDGTATFDVEDGESQCAAVIAGLGVPLADYSCITPYIYAVCAIPDSGICTTVPPSRPPPPPPPGPAATQPPGVIPASPPAPPGPVRADQTTGTGSSSKQRTVILGVAIPVGLLLLSGALIAGALWNRRKTTKLRRPASGGGGGKMNPRSLLEAATINMENRQTRRFKLEEVLAAMGVASFDADNLQQLGRGGFGTVYKGELADGTPVAIKRLHGDIGVATENLVAEVNVLCSVSHRNLVRLLGISVDRNEHILVYEYISNGTLEQALLGRHRFAGELFWERRRDVLLGTARALLYLHHQCAQRIIHRDIKPANILLDSEWQPRLADFGLAKETVYTQEQVTTILKGTPGYIAPEAYLSTQTTLKSDVYSFGIVILVVVSGKHPNYDLRIVEPDCPDGLLGAVIFLAGRERLVDIVDPILGESLATEQVIRFLSVALHCTQPDPELRPTMEQVYYMLDGSADIPKIALEVMQKATGPTIPGFLAVAPTGAAAPSSDEDGNSKPSNTTDSKSNTTDSGSNSNDSRSNTNNSGSNTNNSGSNTNNSGSNTNGSGSNTNDSMSNTTDSRSTTTGPNSGVSNLAGTGLSGLGNLSALEPR